MFSRFFKLPRFALILLLAARLDAQQGSVAAHLASGDAALRSNQPEVAAQEFRAVLAADPSNVEANTNLGVIEYLRGDCRAAAPLLRAALAADPNLPKAQGLAGICGKRLGEPGAQALLESAFMHLDEANLRVQVGVELADMYYQQGDLDRVLPVVHALVALSPDNIDILFFAQRIYSELADQTLNKLAVLAPDSARMQQLIAERLVNAGDLPGAIEHYRKALAEDPRLPGMHFELAESLLEASPSDPKAQREAETQLAAALAVDGDTPRLECALGALALKRGDGAGAREHYARAQTLNPRDAEALLGLARLASEDAKPAEAATYLKSAVEIDPMNAQAHYQLALAYRALKQPEQMAAEMKLFQELKQTKERLATLYRQMNQPRAAAPAPAQP